MHNSYFVLRELGNRLNDLLVGYRLHSCYSQDKDELVLHFSSIDHECFIHAILRNNFSMIRIPENLKRARKNSIDLFKRLSNAQVLKVFCFENERCLSVEFDQSYSLLFKMFGNRSNVILCQDNIPVQIFKKNLIDDLNLTIGTLSRKITFNRDTLQHNDWGFSKIWPVLGGVVKQEIEHAGYSGLDADGKWEVIQDVLGKLENPDYFLHYRDSAPALTLFEPSEWFFHTKDVIQALNEYYSIHVRDKGLQELKKKVLVNLEKQRKKAVGLMTKSKNRLKQLEQHISYREMADLIMANLHAIPPNAERVQLSDFKTGTPVSIKLKSSLSPQKNAEQYYRKSKNQSKETKVLRENLTRSQQKLSEINDHLAFVQECSDFKLLKEYCKKHQLSEKVSITASKPLFREFHFRDFLILIGRNAVNNDVLTQKHAHKDDLWLHAKDVKGSHVVIRQVPGRPFPVEVIERAAQLAAFYSKRKNDSLCPVAYTPKKFVRKPKGAVAGEVIVEREKVILVKPEA